MIYLNPLQVVHAGIRGNQLDSGILHPTSLQNHVQMVVSLKKTRLMRGTSKLSNTSPGYLKSIPITPDMNNEPHNAIIPPRPPETSRS